MSPFSVRSAPVNSQTSKSTQSTEDRKKTSQNHPNSWIVTNVASHFPGLKLSRDTLERLTKGQRQNSSPVLSVVRGLSREKKGWDATKKRAMAPKKVMWRTFVKSVGKSSPLRETWRATWRKFTQLSSLHLNVSNVRSHTNEKVTSTGIAESYMGTNEVSSWLLWRIHCDVRYYASQPLICKLWKKNKFKNLHFRTNAKGTAELFRIFFVLFLASRFLRVGGLKVKTKQIPEMDFCQKCFNISSPQSALSH